MGKINRKYKVLIVDDSDVILSFMKDFFKEYDFEVFTCNDGLEGLRVAAEEKPDLIFLDLMMPNLDGFKMLQVKSVLRDIENIPVIVISANTVRRNVMAALEAGAYKVISKPLNKEQITGYVNEVLGGSNFSETKKVTETEEKDIKDNLAKFFIESFDKKKRTINEAIKTKDAEKLKTVVHEIKGAGGTMGYPELTEISREIEEKEFQLTTDWIFAEMKCNQLFKEIKQIERRITN
jgi:DNA-binding response OmpR family regulator